MHRTITYLLDQITALQIKLAALETMLLQDEVARSRYTELVDAEARKVIRKKLFEGESIN